MSGADSGPYNAAEARGVPPRGQGTDKGCAEGPGGRGIGRCASLTNPRLSNKRIALPVTTLAINPTTPTSPPKTTPATRGGRRDRTLYADSPPPPPCWVLARKCRTMGTEGALRKFCLT